jgi:hypothetical protein
MILCSQIFNHAYLFLLLLVNPFVTSVLMIVCAMLHSSIAHSIILHSSFAGKFIQTGSMK